MSKKRILYFSLERNDSTSWWRSGNVLPYIVDPEFELIDISHIKAFDWSVFAGASILFMQRPFAPEHSAIIALAKDMGLRIILDFDDLLTDVPQENPTHQQYTSTQQSLLACIKMADELWVSTEAIAARFGHPNTHIVPNAWNDYTHPVKERRRFNRETKKVIYRGGGSHMGDVYNSYDLLLETINSNLDYTFSFMGDRYTALEIKCGDNYHIMGGLPIIQFFKYLAIENSNITIFPLVTNHFNRAKSNISFLESAYCGSAFFGNKELPEFNLPFILDLSDLPDKMRDYDLLERNANEGWAYICDTLLLSKINQLRIDRIKENL